MIWSPCRATILPNCPVAIISVAYPPIRVAKLRSKAVGAPPRWMYPSTVSLVSNPVSYSISWAIYSAAFFPSAVLIPSATTLISHCFLRHDMHIEILDIRGSSLVLRVVVQMLIRRK